MEIVFLQLLLFGDSLPLGQAFNKALLFLYFSSTEPSFYAFHNVTQLDAYDKTWQKLYLLV